MSKNTVEKDVFIEARSVQFYYTGIFNQPEYTVSGVMFN
jgi:hypothetical protein